MKSLSSYITEALKVIDKKSDYEIVQVVDRSFGADISDNDFKKLIKKDIDECFDLKLEPNDIISIRLSLNPTSLSGDTIVVKNSSDKQLGTLLWNGSTPDTLLKIFKSFGYNENGTDVDLYKSVVGWKITFVADKGKKYPRTGVATLKLKLEDKAKKQLDQYIKRIGRSISAYYDEKGNGYTGD